MFAVVWHEDLQMQVQVQQNKSGSRRQVAEFTVERYKQRNTETEARRTTGASANKEKGRLVGAKWLSGSTMETVQVGETAGIEAGFLFKSKQTKTKEDKRLAWE